MGASYRKAGEIALHFIAAPDGADVPHHRNALEMKGGSLMMAWLLRMGITLGVGLVPGDVLRIKLLHGLAFRGQPHASQMFSHYLHGQGNRVTLSTAKLLQDDAGVCDRLLREIKQQREQGKNAGHVRISQRDATHDDWRLALGSIAFDWRTNDQGIEVTAAGRYAWSPDQPRITQAIHRWATQLKRRGAKPFTFAGEPTVLEMRIFQQIAGRRTWPTRTYLL